MITQEWHRFKKVVIDTGPLLLYLVGFFRIRDLGRFGYEDRDLILLNEFLENFSEVLITPHALAEMSDIAKSRLKSQSFSSFITASFERLTALGEEYTAKNQILRMAYEVPRFGITDAALMGIAERHILFLTDDGPLFHYCGSVGIPVVHLNELKAMIQPG